jgi:hypothetical protein
VSGVGGEMGGRNVGDDTVGASPPSVCREWGVKKR